MDYLYGKLNKSLEKANYTGGETETADVRVSDSIIYVDVKGVPQEIEERIRALEEAILNQ